MQSSATSVAAYIAELTPERQQVIQQLLDVIRKNIPPGFQEGIGYGMIGYSVPKSRYPAGYHCTPEQPLPFLGIASQKNFVAIYHMGIYANASLLQWFVAEYPKHSKAKLDMGKSCIRFKKMDQIPYELIGQLMQKITVDQWIESYEAAFINKK